LCEDCAKERGLDNPAGFTQLSELIGKVAAAAGAIAEPDKDAVAAPGAGDAGDTSAKCPECGMTADAFKKGGNLGCPRCYSVFDALITPLLPGMHSGVVHRGKIPARSLANGSTDDLIADLEASLREAVKTEDYERAARLRDRIRQLREQG
jgi:protein arginine kinase activator